MMSRFLGRTLDLLFSGSEWSVGPTITP
jgi:hypothetical protein